MNKKERLTEAVLILLIFTLFIYMVSFNVKADNPSIEHIRTYDGDTFYINNRDWPVIIGENMGIRIYGIDTPEIRGKCLKEKELAILARLYVDKTLKNGKHIELRDMQRGKYFRIVADVYVDGYRIADHLINHGLAVEYFGDTKVKDWCE